jgi:hypothetical protein
MPAVRVVDEHLLAPVLVYSGSGGVFENEKVLKAGTGVSLVQVNSGPGAGNLEIHADLDVITENLSKNYVNEIVFNEMPVGIKNGINQFFTLSDDPTDPSTVQIWLNGALLTQDSDYTVTGRVIQFFFDPIISDDIILASYSKRILLKRYVFGERIFIDPTTSEATLQKMPVSSQDLMLFYNGQLLTRGPRPTDNDYTLTGRVITFPRQMTAQDVVLATYSYI